MHATYARWLYRDGHLNAWGKVVYGRPMVWLGGSGLMRHLVTLEVPGRSTGRPRRYPLVIADRHDERYLVSMLGRDAGWVRNLRANGMLAVLRHGGDTPVRLVELTSDPGMQAAVLKRYLQCAPGARPHIPVDHRSPVADFEPCVGRYPVFRVDPVGDAPRTTVRDRFFRRVWPQTRPREHGPRTYEPHRTGAGAHRMETTS